MSEEPETTIIVPMNDVLSPDFVSMLDPRFRSAEALAQRSRRAPKNQPIEEMEKEW